jgi:rhamnopyranosyl-N-acetylglucosaminyl-diphospho-decaprenol beta-1,3/1,4-galactofuranosyltransferase
MQDVAAVIVTRNRCALLRTCLNAIREQHARPSACYVINNASTDDTVAVLNQDGLLADPGFHLINLDVNVGGAGGFHRGMSEAFAAGHEWLWVMDDDCITQPATLAALLAALEAFPPALAPKLLCSRVDWTDGSIHALNVVAIKVRDKDQLYTAPLYNALSIRACTFVSMLVHRTMIQTYGLPNAIFFIWMDDVEWTARVLRREFGVLIPESRVCHATATNAGTLDAPPARFYFYVRNCTWMLLGSNCFSFQEKAFRGFSMFFYTAYWLMRNCWKPAAWLSVLRGLIRGILVPLGRFDPGCRARHPRTNRRHHDGDIPT